MVTAGAEWSIIARSCNRSSSPPAIHRHDTNPTIPLLSLWEKWGSKSKSRSVRFDPTTSGSFSIVRAVLYHYANLLFATTVTFGKGFAADGSRPWLVIRDMPSCRFVRPAHDGGVACAAVLF